ncbi:MAG: ABC transporter permease [Halolamina sp.]|uniref:ABC transporter permease n=1 Tax=Halolamina sp. TaxID=1940283 RepID=UPI002FC39509
MLKYIARRLLVTIPVLIGVTVVISLIVYLAPGNPARIALGMNAQPEAVRELERQMGLNQPPWLRYLEWLWGVLHFDLGESVRTGRPVSAMIARRFPPTMELALASMMLTLIIALPLGVISAVRQYSWIDTSSMVFAIFWLSMPSFWLALILLLLFSVEWSIFPISGRSTPVLGATWLMSLILPAVATGTRRAGLLTRMTRSSMLEILNEDYIRTARGKGIGETAVIYTHAMKNAMIPIITLIGLQIPFIFSGSVIIETVFSWPGMGRLLVNSVLQRDYPIVQGLVLVYAVIVIFSNLLVDIAYSYFDPRIEYE